MTEDMRAMTLRLDERLAFELQLVAEVDGLPVVEVVRRAVTEHITRRASNPEFVARLQDAAERASRLLPTSPGEIVAMWRRDPGDKPPLGEGPV